MILIESSVTRRIRASERIRELNLNRRKKVAQPASVIIEKSMLPAGESNRMQARN